MQGDEVDIWDMSAPLTTVKQIYGLLRYSNIRNGGVGNFAAQYALALGQLQQHGHDRSPFLGTSDLEAELARMAMQLGPQLQCDYRPLC